MRVLLHEWSSSGGLPEDPPVPGAPSPGTHAVTVAAEGRAMLEALVRDACRDPALSVDILLDRRLVGRRDPGPLPRRASVVPVDPGGDVDALVAAVDRCDRIVIIAPEDDGLLAERVAAVRAAGGAALACDVAFIHRAADKPATIHALAARGVPVPAGRVLRLGESLPEGFRLPAVVKDRASCGGAGFARLDTPDALPAATRDRLLEAFVPGTPVGVSCLCGPGGVVPLAPFRQRFAGAPPRFLGGDFSLDRAAARRAAGMAVRAVAALEAPGAVARGWVGVDMILGDREDGLGDRVLEVNPRMTTSFGGLAPLGGGSLLAAAIAIADGLPPGAGWEPCPRDGAAGFEAFG